MKRAVIALFAIALMQSEGLAHEHGAKPAGAGHSDGHGLLEVPAASAPHIVDLKLVKDEIGGFNLYLATERFEFAPEHVNRDHEPGKGHAHIYVDGVKLTRLYGAAYHLDRLPSGTHQIQVTLNANDHREYAVAGKKIAADATVVVP